MSPLVASKPSISTSNWLRVCSRSSLELIELIRDFPIASSSSINTMQGAFSRASLKSLRTRDAPTPTNISTNSEPLILKKGTPDSPATARASKVFPVPGGPTSKTPRGILPPISVYFFGFFKKSTTSTSSSFASSTPATSEKRVSTFPSTIVPPTFCPDDKTPPPKPPPIFFAIRLIIKLNKIKRSKNGKTHWKISIKKFDSFAFTE